MEIWRLNVEQQTLVREPVKESWAALGGRGLSAQILLDEVPAECEPLGAQAKLIFAPGLLVGHRLSSCDRISVGGKSPLTGGIKESNAGGTTGHALTSLGIKALIVEARAASGWWVIVLSPSGARFDSAADLAGLGVYDTAQRLFERYGQHIAAALIGPAGEMKLTAAGIQNLDKDRLPSRIAARGGLGAVMGSKRIKAIVFETAPGREPELADPTAFKQAQKTFTLALLNHPQTASFRDFGTAAVGTLSNMYGAIPVNNFSAGSFDQMDAISADTLRDLILARGGKSDPSHACMPGCIIRCSNVFGDEHGEELVSPLEYETIGLMGSNLGIGDLDVIARLNRAVNDLGLDSIEIGAALGVAADAGLLTFGDGARALQLVDEIRQATPLGRVLGCGAALTGRVYGIERVPVVKGQAISAYDPRSIKGTGVTYATSPQGADHTAGLTIRAKVNHLDPSVQVEASRTAQVNVAGYDSLGACSFAGFGFAAAPEAIRDLLNARYGWQVGLDILQVLGRQTIRLEREFNRRAGFTSAHDRLPEWMTREVLPPKNSVFDVPPADLDRTLDF
jgi:aldehyde:ferredoxin oxidoreductase